MSRRAPLSARVEPELTERFAVLAAQRGRTFSAELRIAMRGHLKGALETNGAPTGPSPTDAPTTTTPEREATSGLRST